MRHRDLLAFFATALTTAASVPACSHSPNRCEDLPPATTTTAPVASYEAIEMDGGFYKGPPKVGDSLYGYCTPLCATGYCTVTAIEGSELTLECDYDCTGRRPVGYRAPCAPGARGIGAHFARMAALEAASVVAFRVLARELALHRAPRSLVRACERAARDEVRHARTTAALARSHGAAPALWSVEPQAPRSVEAIALENAVEGCVRETFGALVAHWQAREASDPRVRAAMKRIARDETRHAALSWSIDAWARSRLDRSARARVDEARAEAARALDAGDAQRPAQPFAARVGLPSAERERALAQTFTLALLVRAAA